ncbi:sensor histidine kinase [Catenulispora rubra]|uniref:sensor histidine kinase n=1 Tax=Catenulispora rubra TaxID=280293 RepID=UPI0018924A0D|nr:histidine kinase [Catenulispora rubra]
MDLPAAPPLFAWVRPAWWRAADTAAAVFFGAASALLLAKHADGALPLLGALVGAVALAWPIAARSRRPGPAFLLSLATLAAIAAWQPRSAPAAFVPLGITLYALATRAKPPVAIATLCAAIAAATATALPDFKHSGGAVLFGSIYLVVWTIGFAVGMHRRYTTLTLRTQLDRQRMDIARELHDVVAHHMSVITVQAGYGGLLLDDDNDDAATPDVARAREALAVIETTGRQALEEMRRLVEVLQAEHGSPPEAGLAPAPGLADLPRLIDHAANAGVRVTLTMTGTERDLPPGESLAAYRIIQEALTNVIKHAGTDSATLNLHFTEDHVEIQVSNGPAKPKRSSLQDAPRSPGRGTAGMRERAQLYGGELHAGPTPDGGYRVHARLPLPSRAETPSAP